MQSDPWNLARNSTNLTVDSSIELVKEVKELQMLMEPIAIKDLPIRKIEKEYLLLNKLTLRDTNMKRLENSKRHQSLNRYADVLPYIDNIVKLNDNAEISPENYINANIIHNPYLEGDLCNFIATQGPLSRTMDQFWKMVELYQVPVIVGIVEKSVMGSKCAQYWPVKDSIETNDYVITIIKSVESGFMDLKNLQLRNKKTNSMMNLEHYHIYDWLDHMHLKNEDFDQFINLLDKLVKIETTQNHPPTIVHCSAGIGRTGSFICSYYLYWQWKLAKKEKKEFRFSIFGLVRHIREQRFGAVQSLQQYNFLHDIVKHF